MTTDLTTRSATTAGLPMELEQLLSSNPGAEEAASAAIEAGVVEQFRAALPGLYANAARGAGTEGIVAVITPWFATYPQPQRTEGEWREWWIAYNTVCGHHSQAALAGALKTWAAKADSEFLPKPGALSDLARATPTAAFKLAAVVHAILQIADDRTDRRRVLDRMDVDQVKPAEQIEAVKGLLADFQARSTPVREMQRRILQRGSANAAKPDAELPYSGGVCPEGHAITRQMMRAMGWPEPPESPPGHMDAPLVGEIAFSEDAGG